MSWWKTDKYTDDVSIPGGMESHAGPKGIACVRLWDSGKTDPGWGGEKFMDLYKAGRFAPHIAQLGVLTGRWNFAFVMRAMAMVCIDIDGKNGGLENVGQLGMLPYTLAETSRSGDGYHLFYSTPWDTWDEDKGFAGYQDRIGIVPGVDIRAIGCVYHYPSQRWNGREIAQLPKHLQEAWDARKQQQIDEIEEIVKLLDSGSPDDLMLMQASLESDLAKPIQIGKRNTTLFAIGSKMHLAAIPDWDDKLRARGYATGLDPLEMDKIISNIVKYGARP